MNKRETTCILVALSFLSACTDLDSVLFVTGTKIGIDADSKPPNLTIGYDRDETFIGPNYESETGAIPAVVGRLESDLAVFNPAIQQVYATGNAARLVTLLSKQDESTEGGAVQGDRNEPARLAPGESKRLVFFRTNSNVGLKVTFAEGVYPESFSFGYKRKSSALSPWWRSSSQHQVTLMYRTMVCRKMLKARRCTVRFSLRSG